MGEKYHFTSLSALKSILLSGDLRFADLGKTNDPSEGEFARDAIVKCIKDSQPAGRSLVAALFDANTTKNEGLSLFSISLSSEEDNAHNWMEYGDHGKGAAIVFDHERLAENLSKLSPFMKFREVVYNQEEGDDEIDKVLKKPTKSDYPDYERALELISLYPFLKHHSYALEKEWRIAFIYEAPAEPQDEKPIFYISRSGFYSLNVKKLIAERAITGIVFGKNVTADDKSKIKEICSELGAELSFATSCVPVCKKGDS